MEGMLFSKSTNAISVCVSTITVWFSSASLKTDGSKNPGGCVNYDTGEEIDFSIEMRIKSVLLYALLLMSQIK